ncbi:MAG: restriction endonuclease subunit S [Steroidobacteraceae bacterium]
MNCLPDIAEIRMGYSFRGRLESNFAGDVSVIQMKDIDEANTLRPESLTQVFMPDLADRHCVQKGDLLFRSRGGSYGAALVVIELVRTVLAAPMLLVRPVHAQVNPAYLQWVLNHPDTLAKLVALEAGTSVKMISKAALEQLEIPLPSLQEQSRIVAIAQLAAHEATLLEQLRLRRNALAAGVLMSYALKG